MKRYKKIIYVILMICILAGSVFAALDFMGVVDLNFRNKKFGEDVSATENENGANTNNPEPWHIVFKGYAFSVEPVGLAIIHESGCINIRSCDEYLIQIDVEDGTAEEFWNGRDDCVKNMEDSGYVIELAPEKVELQGRELFLCHRSCYRQQHRCQHGNEILLLHVRIYWVNVLASDCHKYKYLF